MGSLFTSGSPSSLFSKFLPQTVSIIIIIIIILLIIIIWNSMWMILYRNYKQIIE